MTLNVRPGAPVPPRELAATTPSYPAHLPLWQRTFYEPPAPTEAVARRRGLLAESRRSLAPGQRSMLRTMGWHMRVPPITSRDQGNLSGLTPHLPDEFAAMAQQAVAVASGMHGVYVQGVDLPMLRHLCRQKFNQLHGLEALFLGEGAPSTVPHDQTPATRASVWAFMQAFCEGAHLIPAASLPKLYFTTFFRPLAVAFAAAGLTGLWRAQAYLSCCEGAQHAAFLAFHEPMGRSAQVDRQGTARPGARRVRFEFDIAAGTARLGPVETLRPTRPALRARVCLLEPPAPTSPDVRLPADLRFARPGAGPVSASGF